MCTYIFFSLTIFFSPFIKNWKRCMVIYMSFNVIYSWLKIVFFFIVLCIKKNIISGTTSYYNKKSPLLFLLFFLDLTIEDCSHCTCLYTRDRTLVDWNVNEIYLLPFWSKRSTRNCTFYYNGLTKTQPGEKLLCVA